MSDAIDDDPREHRARALQTALQARAALSAPCTHITRFGRC